MTREEAIDIIKCLAWHTRPNEEDIEQAIKELEKEPTYTSQIAQKAYEDGKKDGYVQAKLEQEPMLDKIKIEIKALSNANPSYWHSGDMVDRDDVLEIIDKYKAEQEQEDGKNVR